MVSGFFCWASVLNLPDGQANFFWKFQLSMNCNQTSSKIFSGPVEMTFGLVHACYSLAERQAVKQTLLVAFLQVNDACTELF